MFFPLTSAAPGFCSALVSPTPQRRWRAADSVASWPCFDPARFGSIDSMVGENYGHAMMPILWVLRVWG